MPATVASCLEAAYHTAHEGEIVRPSRLAEWLGVSPSTVTGVVQRLCAQGLPVIRPDHSLTLTAQGVTVASVIVRRHRAVERWLTDEIGLDWAAADEEAGRISHAFSDQLTYRILAKPGEPVTCPHGNEIPGVDGSARGLVNLADLVPELVAPVPRVSEVAEREAPQLLSPLDRGGLRIGVELAVIRPSGLGGSRSWGSPSDRPGLGGGRVGLGRPQSGSGS